MKHLPFLFFLTFSPLAQARLPEGITALHGTAPDLSSGDLQAMDRLIQNAQIVALGESAHGSKNFIQLRQRVIQYLVREKGFKTIFWENPTFKTMKVNDYVAGKINDRNEILSAFAAVEKNIEFLDLIEWIRTENLNRNEGDKITLRGFDIWDDPWAVKDILVHVFRLETDIEARTQLRAARQQCFAFQYSDWATFMKTDEYTSWAKNKKFEDARYFGCMNAVTALHAHIVKNRARLEKELGKNAVLFAQMALHLEWGYEQDLHFLARDFRQGETARDHAQARIFELERKLDGEDRKVILLAHNLHISKAQSQVELKGWDRIPSMGEHLSRKLKSAYIAFAITGYDVINVEGHFPLPTSQDSLEVNLKSLGDALFVNTASSFVATKPKWYLHLEEIPNGEFLSLQQNFDGVFFVRESLAPSPLQ